MPSLHFASTLLFFFSFFSHQKLFSLSRLAVHRRRFSLIKKVIILEERGAACLFFSVFADRGKEREGEGEGAYEERRMAFADDGGGWGKDRNKEDNRGIILGEKRLISGRNPFGGE